MRCRTCGGPTYQPESFGGRRSARRCEGCHYTPGRCRCKSAAAAAGPSAPCSATRWARLYGWRIRNLICAATRHRAFDRCRPGYYDGDGRETWDDYQARADEARDFRLEYERRWGDQA